MKIRIMSVFCMTLLLCSGCGMQKEEIEIENAGAAISGGMAETAPAIDTNVYFDTSDLTYVGKYEQRIAIGYDFENPEDDDPVLVQDEYISADGEIFRYDDQGRLVYYRNEEEIFDNTATSAENASARNVVLEDCAAEVFESCMKVKSGYTITKHDEYGTYYMESASLSGPENPDCAMVKMNTFGDVRSYKVSYNTLTVEVDEACEAYFEKKLQSYIDEVKERYDIESYETRVRYEQLGNKLYALYTCEFLETDGAAFAEAVGFTKVLSQDGDEVM